MPKQLLADIALFLRLEREIFKMQERYFRARPDQQVMQLLVILSGMVEYSENS